MSASSFDIDCMIRKYADLKTESEPKYFEKPNKHLVSKIQPQPSTSAFYETSNNAFRWNEMKDQLSGVFDCQNNDENILKEFDSLNPIVPGSYRDALGYFSKNESVSFKIICEIFQNVFGSYADIKYLLNMCDIRENQAIQETHLIKALKVIAYFQDKDYINVQSLKSIPTNFPPLDWNKVKAHNESNELWSEYNSCTDGFYEKNNKDVMNLHNSMEDFGDFISHSEKNSQMNNNRNMFDDANEQAHGIPHSQSNNSIASPEANQCLNEDYSSNIYREWGKCLDQCLSILVKSNSIFTKLPTNEQKYQFSKSGKGHGFLLELVEVYCISRRINSSIRLLNIHRPDLEQAIRLIDYEWSKIKIFVDMCPDGDVLKRAIVASDNHLLSSHPIRTHLSTRGSCSLVDTAGSGGVQSTTQQRCGICLAPIVKMASGAPSTSSTASSSIALNDGMVLLHGHTYHASCARLWVNRVQYQLPSLNMNVEKL